MGRKVISFSLWGDLDMYNAGAVANAALAPKIYPGWICRFHVQEGSSAIRWLGKFRHVEVVSKSDEPGYAKAFWRFLAAADPDVERVVFRDCDSRLNFREKAAVDEWIASGMDAHIMRDIETHAGLRMLAGMSGLRGGLFPDMGKICREWVSANDMGRKPTDEEFLNSVVWPRIRNSVMVHGFQHTSGGERVRPFPRVPPGPGEYVGQTIHPSIEETAMLKGKRWKWQM